MRSALLPAIVAIISSNTLLACPIGTVPLRGNGWEGCAPANESSQSSGQRWRTQWGSIAIDGSKDVVAASTQSRTKKISEKLALEECRQKGGDNCRIDLSYFNQCAAVIASPTSFYTQSAVTEDAAIERGLNRCRQSEHDCEVRYSACSLPSRR